MITLQRTNRLLAWMVGLSVVGWLALALWPEVAPTPAQASVKPAPRVFGRASQAMADSAIAAITRSATFQLFHGQPPVTAVVPGQGGAPSLVRPALVLTALAGSARPAAVLEGVPGVDGARVFRVGDTSGGVRLVAIKGAVAMVSGFDTIWQLRVRQP